ncbi:MAG: hypothetical protein ACRD3A_12660 [Terriglobales bacterium]
MAFLSASEDFLTTTLAALPGVWGKLQYLSGLRNEAGDYDHWGLTRLHGEAAVQRALGEAHRDVFLEILRTPLTPLLEEAGLSAADRELDPASYLLQLSARSRALLPSHLGGGTEPHFSSVLKALSMLARARSSATRRAA